MRTLASFLVLMVLAGCAGPEKDTATTGATTSTTSAGMLQEHFDAGTNVPSGWTADAGNWSVVAQSTAPSAPNALRGEGGGGRSTLRATGTFGDFDATVKFLMVSGDEGAGLSFRYGTDGAYRIVRYSVREQGWHYFFGQGNSGEKKNEATVNQTDSHPDYNEWVKLQVRAEGKHVRAWDNGTLVIDFMEPNDLHAGAVGPFVRGKAVAWFDDLVVTSR